MRIGKKYKKYKIPSKLSPRKINRQTIGFILLLLVFAFLLYTALIVYNETPLFTKTTMTESKTQNPNTGMTYISIIYKNSTKSNIS